VRAEPPTLRRFSSFFQKNKAFLWIFWSKFLLRNVFLNDCKVCCWCVLILQGLRWKHCYSFSKKKITHFGLTFSLKAFFKWLQSVLMRQPQGLCPRLCCLKLLTGNILVWTFGQIHCAPQLLCSPTAMFRLIVHHSYDRVIKTLRACCL